MGQQPDASASRGSMRGTPSWPTGGPSALGRCRFVDRAPWHIGTSDAASQCAPAAGGSGAGQAGPASRGPASLPHTSDKIYYVNQALARRQTDRPAPRQPADCRRPPYGTTTFSLVLNFVLLPALILNVIKPPALPLLSR